MRSLWVASCQARDGLSSLLQPTRVAGEAAHEARVLVAVDKEPQVEQAADLVRVEDHQTLDQDDHQLARRRRHLGRLLGNAARHREVVVRHQDAPAALELSQVRGQLFSVQRLGAVPVAVALLIHLGLVLVVVVMRDDGTPADALASLSELPAEEALAARAAACNADGEHARCRRSVERWR